MKTVHRYPIDISDIPTAIPMSPNARLLHVAYSEGPARDGWSDDTVDLWAEVETLDPKINRSFVVKGTGQALGSARMHYVGTAVSPPDYPRLVWHVYEVV